MSRMKAMKENIIADYDGWSVTYDGLLKCPCGHRVEDDGQCPEGHVSPLRQMGMI